MSAFKHSALGVASFAMAFGLGIWLSGGRGKSADGERSPVAEHGKGGPSALPEGGGSRKFWRGRPGRGRRAHIRFGLRELPLGEIAGVAAEMVADYRAGEKVGFDELLEVWAERDPEAALRWFEDGMPREFDEGVRKQFFLGWGRSDPAAALEYARTKAIGDWRETFVAEVFKGAAQADPEEAGRMLGELEEKPWSLVEQVLFFAAREDPLAAYAIYESLSSERKYRIGAITDAIIDPQALEDLSEQVGHPLSSDYSVVDQRRFAAMTVDEVRAELMALAENPSGAHHSLQTLARYAPSKFAEALLSADPASLPERVGSIRTLSDNLNVQGRAELLRALLAQPEFEDEALESINIRHNAESRRRVADVIADLEGDLQGRLQVAFTGTLVNQSNDGPSYALEYVDAIDDPGIRDAALLEVAEEWGDQNPRQALEWAVAQSEGSGLIEVVGVAAQRQAIRNPTAAAAWLSGVAVDSPHYEVAVEGTADGLLAAALAQSSGSSRELALTGLGEVFASVTDQGVLDVARRAMLERVGGGSAEELLNHELWTPEDVARLQPLFQE